MTPPASPFSLAWLATYAASHLHPPHHCHGWPSGPLAEITAFASKRLALHSTHLIFDTPHYYLPQHQSLDTAAKHSTTGNKPLFLPRRSRGTCASPWIQTTLYRHPGTLHLTFASTRATTTIYSTCRMIPKSAHRPRANRPRARSPPRAAPLHLDCTPDNHKLCKIQQNTSCHPREPARAD